MSQDCYCRCSFLSVLDVLVGFLSLFSSLLLGKRFGWERDDDAEEGKVPSELHFRCPSSAAAVPVTYYLIHALAICGNRSLLSTPWTASQESGI